MKKSVTPPALFIFFKIILDVLSIFSFRVHFRVGSLNPAETWGVM